MAVCVVSTQLSRSLASLPCSEPSSFKYCEVSGVRHRLRYRQKQRLYEHAIFHRI
jgi:hypothetical protein